jgi:hypothetical protein
MQPMGYAPAPQYGAPQTYGAPTGPTYEFNEMENATLSSTARFAKIWGIISLISGVLLLIVGILIIAVIGAAIAANAGSSSSSALKPATVMALGFALIPSSLVSIIGGIFYLRSGSSLQNVVTTHGNDIPLLMEATRALSRAFMIEAIAMMVGFVLGFVIGILNAAAGGST